MFWEKPQAALRVEKVPRRRLLRSAVYNSGGWAVTVLISVGFTPYVVHKLTVEGYGIYAMFTTLVGYYMLLDFGLGQSLLKFIPEHEAANDYVAMNRCINTVVCIQILAGGLCSGFLIAFAGSILRWVSVPPAFWSIAKAGLIACAIGFFFSMLSGTINALLMGLQRYDVTSKLGILRDLLVNVSLVTVLFLGGRLKAAIYATVFFTILIFGVYLRTARRILPQWRLSLTVDKAHFWLLLSFGVFMFVSTLAQSFANYFMRFVLSAMASPSAVTYFSVPFKIIVGFASFSTAGIAVLLPFSAEIAARGDREGLRDIFLRTAKYNVVFLLPGLALMGVFSRLILTVWMGADFAGHAWLAMGLLCLSSFISSIGAIPAIMAFGLGHSRLVAGFSLAAMILAAAMAIPMIHLWGVTGAALAAALASPVWVVFSFYVAARLLGVDFATHFNRVYKFHVVVGLPFLAAALLFANFAAIHGTSELAVALVCSAASYYGLIALTRWVEFGEIMQLLRSWRPA